MKDYFSKCLGRDFASSIVVFLVALPLCMGIAIASGVPPILGLMSGIIGGLVVGVFAGAPLQVSGPAAGLAVMVFEFVKQYGLEALAPLGIMVGVLQLVVFKFKLAEWFRAISPALIKGLLSGIGLLILLSQVYVAFDASPVGSGLANLIQIPQSFHDFVIMEGGGRMAFAIAVSTLVSIILWQRFAPKLSKVFPAPLFAIVVVAAGTVFFGADVKFIQISSNFMNELNFIKGSHLNLISFNFLLSCTAIAFVASAETLLSVTATDKLAGGKQSDYNKEIMAQGLGNMVAGIFGALPLTGVIVRSSANIESGAKTRGSAVMHGIWLALTVFLFTSVLSFIPMSALAGILIFTGWRLMDLKSIPALVKKSKSEAAIFFVTFGLIVSVDLLTGVVVGFVTSVAVLLHKLHQIEVHRHETEEEVTLTFKGTASFLQVPVISKSLPNELNGKTVTLNLDQLDYIDWAVEEQLKSWKEQHEKQGAKLRLVHTRADNLSKTA